MAKPKVLDLIESLSSDEKKEFNDQIKKNDKKLSQLFKSLSKYTDQTWKEELKKSIYQDVYNEKYQKQYDYLLRNMFRNLKEKIEEYLIQKEFENELQSNLNLKNYFLLKSLKNRNLFHLFELNFPTALKNAEKSLDFQMASAICSLNFNNYALHYLPNVKNLKKAKELNDLYKSYLSSFYLNAYLQGKYNQFMLDEQQNKLDEDEIQKVVTGSNFTFDLSKNENPFSKYLKLKTRLFSAPSEEKINILNTCLDLLKNIHSKDETVMEELLFCRSTLALEYSLEGYYEKADKLYKQIFSNKESFKTQVEKSGFCDYLVNLIKLGKYKTVLDLINRYKEDFNSDENHFMKIHSLEITTYAFTGNHKKLFWNLPQNFKGVPNYLKHFYRFFFCICFYLKGEYEDALRESNNFKGTIKNKTNDSGNFNVKDIVYFFNKFFYFIVQKKDVEYYQMLNKLNEEIEEYNFYVSNEIKEYLPFVWLKNEVKKHLSEAGYKPYNKEEALEEKKGKEEYKEKEGML